MDTTKTGSHGAASLHRQVQQFLGRFAQTGDQALSDLLSAEQLE